MSAPHLSVVVALVDGHDALRRCLTALLSQQHAPPMEIIVPYDSTTADAARLVADVAGGTSAPEVRGIDIGIVSTRRPPYTMAGQHELIDRRRSAGLASAKGEVVAMVEDRAVPRRDWAATLARLHRELPHAVIGGAIENGRDRLLNWAVYYCDFGRQQLPFAAGARAYVSDVNLAYKRRALDKTRGVWSEEYHEPVVHWALEQAGETLFLSPDVIVDEMREGLTLRGLVLERLAWGRLFGSLRVHEAPPGRRLGLVASAPFVPAVLFARFLRIQLRRGTSPLRILSVTPAVGLLLTAWSAGEAVGYLAGPA
jgi:hypothetical protein